MEWRRSADVVNLLLTSATVGTWATYHYLVAQTQACKQNGPHKEIMPKKRKNTPAHEKNYSDYMQLKSCLNTTLGQCQVKFDEFLVVSTAHCNHLLWPCIADHEMCIRQAVASDLQGKDHRSPLFRTSLSPHEA